MHKTKLEKRLAVFFFDCVINLSGLPISFFIVHGNHEERASEISSYKQKRWRGGIVYYEEEFPDILFAKDGEIYDFNGKSVIAIGGAYSVDKYYRLSVSLPWYESEQPSAEIKAYVEEGLERCQWKVDFVLSHTCPLCLQPEDLFLDYIDQSRIDKSTEEWLERLYKKLRYERWYFGHFHGNRQDADIVMLYEEIRELGADEFLQRIGRPMYKKGDYVMFYPDGDRNYRDGKIAVIDAWGSPVSQFREVCYDIAGADGILYKQIPETSLLLRVALSFHPGESGVSARKQCFLEAKKKMEEENLKYSEDRVFQDELHRTLTLVFEDDFKEYM